MRFIYATKISAKTLNSAINQFEFLPLWVTKAPQQCGAFVTGYGPFTVEKGLGGRYRSLG